MRGLKLLKKKREVVILVASFTDAWIETKGSKCAGSKSLSHLLQMRGLKPLALGWKWKVGERSHLLQMRGLKPLYGQNASPLAVASFTDAWIETGITGIKTRWWGVASFTDAWIETSSIAFLIVSTMSHLLQMRGLKLIYLGINGNPHKVASFTDAWIETRSLSVQHSNKFCRIFYRCVD